jgi:hypothetical protein
MAAIELDTEAADVHRESSSSDYLSDERSEVEGLGTRRPTMKYIEVLSKLEAMGVPEETLEGLSRNEAYDMLRTLRDGSEEVLPHTDTQIYTQVSAIGVVCVGVQVFRAVN